MILLPGYFVGWYKVLFVEHLQTCERYCMVAVPANDTILYYIMIEAGSSDNPGVHIKGVSISKGPL